VSNVRIGERKNYCILIEDVEGIGLLGGGRSRREDNIKLHFEGIKCGVWTDSTKYVQA
jgi:hypothetical protein